MRNNKINSANRVYFKNSLKNDERSKTDKILYTLAGISGIINAGLWLIVAIKDYAPYEHPIIFGIGLGSLFAVLIAGFIISCIREYRYDPEKLKNTLKKIGIIILCSCIFTGLLFALMFYSIMNR